MQAGISPSLPQNNGPDIKAILFRFLSRWYLFVIGVILGLAGAKLYLRYQENIYTVSTTMLLKAYSDSYRTLGGLELFDNKNNIGDEIQIIKSFDMITKVLAELDFDISYYHQGDIRTMEFYGNSPIRVVPDSSVFQLAGVPLYVTLLGGNRYRLEAVYSQASLVNLERRTTEKQISGEHISQVYHFGEPVRLPHLAFTLYLQDPYYKQPEGKLYFMINRPDLMTYHYKNLLNIAPMNKESSILRLSLSGPLVDKDIQFLNTVTQVYIREGLEEKNRIATNTISFIDEQLAKISDSLKTTEKQIETFQEKYNFQGTEQGLEKAIDKLDDLENEKADLIMKTEYYQYVLDYIRNNKDLKEIVAPSSIGIEDAILSGLIDELIKLKSERSVLIQTANDKNPYIRDIDRKIDITTQTLYENVNNILKVSDIPIRNINKRIVEIERSLNGLPEKDRLWLDIERKFNLNNHLYNFLLEKRAEAAITKASSKPDHEVVEKASRLSAFQIAPKRATVYNVGVMLGLLIPLGILLGLDYLNDRIRSREDLLRYTRIPILGSIGHKELGGNLVVSESPKSGIAEAFRSIRINLSYLASEQKTKVIVVSSSISGEGKTFFSINLGNILAISEKRTLLIGADLRKPRIYDDFGLQNQKGLSTYLANKSGLTDIINKTFVPNFDIITSGPVPPNPAELLGSQRMEELVEDLREWYDYIIIDTPPIGLVADGFYLMKYSDINIYMVRHKYTRYKMLEKINLLYSEGKVKNLGMVINDLNYKDAKYYGYGNSYGYGYGNSYGYYEEGKEEKNIMKKIRSIIRV